MSLTKPLDTLTKQYHKDYRKALKKVVADLRKNHIIPFCDKHKYAYLVDFETWWVWDGDGNLRDSGEYSSPYNLPTKVRAALNMLIPDSEQLGTLVKDYLPKSFTKQERANVLAKVTV